MRVDRPLCVVRKYHVIIFYENKKLVKASVKGRLAQ